MLLTQHPPPLQVVAAQQLSPAEPHLAQMFPPAHTVPAVQSLSGQQVSPTLPQFRHRPPTQLPALHVVPQHDCPRLPQVGFTPHWQAPASSPPTTAASRSDGSVRMAPPDTRGVACGGRPVLRRPSPGHDYDSPRAQVATFLDAVRGQTQESYDRIGSPLPRRAQRRGVARAWRATRGDLRSGEVPNDQPAQPLGIMGLRGRGPRWRRVDPTGRA